MKKKSLLLGMLTVITVVMLSVFFVSCGGGDDDSNSGYSGSGNVGVSISGTWYNSAADETMILGKDGSYYSYLGKDTNLVGFWLLYRITYGKIIAFAFPCAI